MGGHIYSWRSVFNPILLNIRLKLAEDKAPVELTLFDTYKSINVSTWSQLRHQWLYYAWLMITCRWNDCDRLCGSQEAAIQNRRYAEFGSSTTKGPPKQQSALKDKWILWLYVCIRPWWNLGVSRAPWLEHVASDDMKIESTKSLLSSSRTRRKHTSRDPILLPMSSAIPLSSSYAIICAHMTHHVV
jgi:hypothetical protein